MATARLIKTGLDVLYFSGCAALSRQALRGRGTIFCLHHVLPAQNNRDLFSPNSQLEITPQFLAEIIELVRRRGYETLSLSDAISSLEKPAARSKPFAVFTLDDGYKDNQVHGQPVFQKYNCPYTVFVVPGIVEGTTELWWRVLEQIISENSLVAVSISGQDFSLQTDTISQKKSAWSVIYPILRDAPEFEQRRIIREMAERYQIDLRAFCNNLAMNWTEIRTLARDPLCTIGAHTLNHYLVAKLSPEDAKCEMQQSAAIISLKLGMPVKFFAYPYGDESAAGPRDFAIAKELGFVASLTTRKGVVTTAHVQHQQALPRVMVSGRFNSIRYIDCLISGAPTFLLNGFKTLNVT